MPELSTATLESPPLPGTGTGCFHCGLPLPEDSPAPVLQVLGLERPFCCHGCKAVCKAIADAGLEEYYRYRTGKAVSGRQPHIPEFLRQAAVYDRPEIQKGFVRATGEWREASLLLENIRCAACLWLNERRLRSLPGVVDVHIDDATQHARVRWDPAVIRLGEILAAIAGIGYIAHPYDASRDEQLRAERRRRSIERLVFAGAAGMMVMNFSLATYFMGDPGAGGPLPLWIVIGRWSSLLIVTLILGYSGQDFFAGAWSDLKNARPGMDIPVALGLSAAWLGSLWATVSGHGEVYFDSIAMFVFLVLLARRWELRGRLRAADRLARLARFTPRSAIRLDASGRREDVPVTDLAPGDRVLLLPGAAVPVDGIIVEGSSSFDESLLTGEATPVLHRPGERVVAGAVNGEQPVTITVTHTLDHSAITEIRRLVERGLERRPRYADLAEQAAGWFVAALLLVAAATAVYWLRVEPALWLSSTIAVLIVTCPCALALATPVALAVSAGRLIDLGVLPLRMQAVDGLARSDLFAFDKTGTLTAGRPRLVAVRPTGSLDRDSILRHAAALAANSEHPLARALRGLPPEAGIDVERYENVPGAGIRAWIAGAEWRLGRPGFAVGKRWLEPEIRHRVDECRAAGYLVALLSGPRGIEALLTFEDPVRPGAAKLLAGLAQAGVRQFALLSGDAAPGVARLGARLGIRECHGRMSPADKLAWTRSRQREGRRVAMFGDGINDAPTLAAADVSISFSDATDLANISSDFLILGDDASALAAARRVARRTRSNIVQNFAWAAAYNLVAIPYAAMGSVPPWAAAIGMSCSSLIVVLNALRLQRGQEG
jgi:Cu2+-exporting ATPase